MSVLRAVARAALGWVFVRSGFDVLRNPVKPATTAGPLLRKIREASPAPMPDDVTVVRANAAVHLSAGTALGLGIAPRAAAALLMASLVPTTLGGHAFWAVDDPALRPNQRNHFNKNVAMFGGLLLVVLDRRHEE